MGDAAAEKVELQVVVAPAIEKRIFVIRGGQVMLDEDLADLYGAETRVLVQQVKRNAKRFPADFMFQLTKPEAEALRSHFVISNEGRGGRRHRDHAGVRGVAAYRWLISRASEAARSDGTGHRGASERARRAASSDLRSATAVDRAAAQHEAAHRLQGPRGRRLIQLGRQRFDPLKYCPAKAMPGVIPFGGRLRSEEAAALESAGILLFRRGGESVEVLLVHPGGPYWAKRDLGAWSIPKGERGEGEELRQRALVELDEELGAAPPLNPGDLIELGSVRQKGGKTVHAWAAEGDFDPAALRSNSFELEWPPRSGALREFPEVDRAEWFEPETARRKLIAAQAAFVDRLLERIG